MELLNIKIMKKIILLLIFFISMWITNNSHALSCPIKKWTAQVLLDYSENNSKIIDNISNEINDSTNNSPIKNEAVSLFNEIFNFWSFYSYDYYFSVYQITNEIPDEIKRDYDFLESEWKWLISYFKSIDSSLINNRIINACNWIENWCDFENETARYIIWQLIENNDKILHLYRLTVMWEPESKNSGDLILVDENFISEIQENYWSDIVDWCNKEWDLYKKVTEAITNITTLNKKSEDWIQKWKDAWNLLVWNKPDLAEKEEKKLLKKYLGWNWVATENQEILNFNLNKYNQKWIDKNNNFFASTLNTVYSKVSKEIKEWNREVIKTFFDNEGYENPNLNDIKKVSNNSILSQSIQEKISILYYNEVPYTAVWDVDTEKLRAELIETHFSLDSSINTLAKWCKKSTKFCDRQDKWQWKCWKCK